MECIDTVHPILQRQSTLMLRQDIGQIRRCRRQVVILSRTLLKKLDLVV